MQISSLSLQSSDKGRRPRASAFLPGENAPALPLETSILIVEDEVLIAWSLHDMLVEMGFVDVRVARDGDEAVELAGVCHPGMLICDVNLGAGDDGVATAIRLRSMAWVPVLFVTGYAGDDIRSRIDQMIGAAPLMRKPIQPRPLARCLSEASLEPKPN